MNDRLRTSLSKAEADATLAMRERDDALLLLSEASSTKPDMGREAPAAQGPTNPESRRPSLADQGLPPPTAPASAEPRQEGDGTEDLLLRLLKDKVTDQVRPRPLRASARNSPRYGRPSQLFSRGVSSHCHADYDILLRVLSG
jgi:hypothetical protein